MSLDKELFDIQFMLLINKTVKEIDIYESLWLFNIILHSSN